MNKHMTFYKNIDICEKDSLTFEDIIIKHIADDIHFESMILSECYFLQIYADIDSSSGIYLYKYVKYVDRDTPISSNCMERLSLKVKRNYRINKLLEIC